MPQLEKEQDFRDEKRKFVPSQDLAWMLGVLAGGGHVDKRGYVSVFGNEDPFLRIVDLIGTRLFRKNSVIKEIKRNRKGQAYKSITFYSKDLAVQIGDLRRDKYPTTIIEKHRWIVQDLKSTASFLSGILDTRGIVQVSPKAV
ncbi:hypothetical protein M1307_03045, partial [Patescibacteria group bacterium]|nr:hypothetical protein [Patescibacteria group bacterium]